MTENLSSNTTASYDAYERVKSFAVYGTATFAVVGGLLLVGAMTLFGIISADIGVPAIMVIIGAAVQFLFAEAQSRRTEATMERANIVARSTLGSE